jgi:hypothetical protein
MAMTIADSNPLVLLVPNHRLPKLNLISVGINNPRKLPVLVRLRTANYFDSTTLELDQHFIQIIHSIINHEKGVARAEPLAAFLCDVLHREALILCFVVRPFQHCTTKALEGDAEMLLIPGCERFIVTLCYEKDSTNSSNFRHLLLHLRIIKL